MKKFEIKVIFQKEAFRFVAEAEDKKEALRIAADEFYKYFGRDATVDGYVVNEVN